MIPLACTLALLGGLLLLFPQSHRAAPSRRRPAPGLIVHPAQAVAAGLALAAITLVVTALPAVALLAGGVGCSLPAVLRRRQAAQRRRGTAQAWPAILDDVTSALRAGCDLPTALLLAGERAPEALRPAFLGFEREYRRSGSFDVALAMMEAHLADPVFTQLQRSLRVARQVGGHDLTRVLRSLTTFVRADLQLRGELAARQSWTVNAARLAVAAPWVVLALLCTRGSTISAYATPTGTFVLLAVAATSALAYLAMLRVARLDEVAA